MWQYCRKKTKVTIVLRVLYDKPSKFCGPDFFDFLFDALGKSNFFMYVCTSTDKFSPTMNQEIFREIQALERQLLPDEKVILFGSQARGDARADSDWDLLILLNKEKRNRMGEYDKYGYPFDKLGIKCKSLINPVIQTVKDWEAHPSVL